MQFPFIAVEAPTKSRMVFDEPFAAGAIA